MDKRSFLKNLSLMGLGAGFPFLESLAQTMELTSEISARDLAQQEDFWAKIRQGYLLSEDYINLENGYYCMMPQETLQHYQEQVKQVNFLASRYMRTVQFQNRNQARDMLAEMAGCSHQSKRFSFRSLWQF